MILKILPSRYFYWKSCGFPFAATVGVLLGLALWLCLPVGVYFGGDWGLPVTDYQARHIFSHWAWSDGQNFGTPYLMGLLVVPYELLVLVTSKLLVPVEYFGKLLLVA